MNGEERAAVTTAASVDGNLPGQEGERFERLWSRCAPDGGPDPADGRFAALQRHYLEPHRRYHTAEHLNQCLVQLDAARQHMDHPDAVELAVWYHDAIYDVTAGDNELQSARLFARHAAGILPASLVETVHELIMVTAHCRVEPSTSDQDFMVDIDLSSFGLPWLEFLRDSVAVREESPHLSDEVFYAKQRKFLTTLLSREHFYFTAFFRERHEQRARDNVSRYLASLGRGTSHEGAGE